MRGSKSPLTLKAIYFDEAGFLKYFFINRWHESYLSHSLTLEEAKPSDAEKSIESDDNPTVTSVSERIFFMQRQRAMVDI